MSQIAIFFRLRRQLLQNRLGGLSSRRRTLTALLLLGSLGGILLGGHLAAPTLMEPPLDLATPRGLSPEDLPAGAAALEAAFWLTALLAAVLNFRVLELLFRRNDIRTLQTLPIAPEALFLDRLLASIGEAFITAFFASFFFLPLLWHGGGPAALASFLMLLGGLGLGALIALATMILATQQLVPGDDDAPKGPRRTGAADSYGGTGQILLYAPALSLGAIVLAALFWKLLLGEPLRLARISEPFLIGSAILTATALFCLLYAFKAFVAHYYAMAPRFHEADAAEFSTFISYQESSFSRKRAWEFGLSPRSATIYRALSIDDDRRVAGARVGYSIVLVLAILAMATIELSAMPTWALATAPLILIAALVNPWARLARRTELINAPMAMPVSSLHRQLAAARASIREFYFIAFPYALAAALILGYFRGMGLEVLPIIALAIISGPGLAAALAMAGHFGAPGSALRWLPAFLLAILVSITIVSLPAAIVVSLILVGAHLLLFQIPERRHVEA